MAQARWLILTVIAIIHLTGWATPVRAQVDLLDQMNRQQGTLSEIGITIESVGLNNAARPGEWAGIRLRLIDRGQRQRNVLVRIVLTDVDGDDALYENVVTTNPNVEQPVWAYARLPFDIASTGGFTVLAFEAEEADDSSTGVGFIATDILGQATYRWAQNMGKSTGLIAVVGTPPGGLAGYGQGITEGANPLGHEVSQVAPMSVESLPDRWMGLAMVREIIWNGPSPADLRIEQVRALREWVERGGNLVIILPAVGQDWLALGNRELAALLPRVEVTRHENEPLVSLRNLLTDQPPDKLFLPDLSVTLHTFEPLADAEPGQADRILNDAQSRCVVASRSVGIGAVTLVGIPGWHPALTSKGLPETDVFWHRVLGRRGQVATPVEKEALDQQDRYFSRGRPARVFDSDINVVIGKSGRSLAGVMMGLIVFIAYWIVAGPGGFALLKQRGQSQHAWLAFFAATIAFTAIAWGGATVLRPKRVEVSHLSFVDHVYGQRIQRVKTWASILVPVYGNATVWLDSDDAASAGGSRFIQTVAPWESAQLTSRGSFPDARDYTIDSRNPDRLTFPARATVKQVQLDWAGGLEWQSIRPQVPEGGDPFTAIGFSPSSAAALQGSMIHNLPGTLENVQVILFRQQIPVRPLPDKSILLASASAWTTDTWEPGVPLDLEAVTIARDSSFVLKIDNLVSNSFSRENLPSASSQADRFTWLAFFNLLGPPEKANNLSQPPVARRQATHALDLSRWSTRPCLIVIGTLKIEGKDSIPLPMGVATNGSAREPNYSGTTIIRWVYPLPDNPPDVPVQATAPTQPTTSGDQ